MLSCYGCVNRETTKCAICVGWNRYESNTMVNPSLAMSIDKEMKMLAKHALNKMFGVERLERRENTMTIKKVYFNDPATVVIWKGGTKTIVKAGENDIYDPEKGLAMAIAKKALGNQGNYYNVFKKWLPEEVRTVEIEMTSDDILLVQSDGSKVGLKDIASKFTGDEKEVDQFEEVEEAEIKWLSVKEVAYLNELSEKYVRKQIKDGFIPLAEKVGGKWKIPCYVFDDHVEVKCM